MLAHGAFQILELDRRRSKQLRGQFDAVKFLRLVPACHGSGAEVFESAFEAIRLLGHAHLFPLRQTRTWNLGQGVLFSLRSMVKW